VTLDEWRRQVRIGVSGRDAAVVVDALSAWLPAECLQAAGSALLAVSDRGVEAAVGLAVRCGGLLSDRDWEGDAELAAELDAAFGAGPASTLRPVPVDLEDLADALSGPLGGDPAVLDLETGEVWPAAALEYAREIDDMSAPVEPDGVRSVEVWPDGSEEPYRDMRDFIAGLDNGTLAAGLARAIEGRGAFGRFRDAVDRWPDEATRWHAFSDDRRLGRARAWLADAGLRPVSRSVRVDE
jgi:hypothetical protein